MADPFKWLFDTTNRATVPVVAPARTTPPLTVVVPQDPSYPMPMAPAPAERSVWNTPLWRYAPAVTRQLPPEAALTTGGPGAPVTMTSPVVAAAAEKFSNRAEATPGAAPAAQRYPMPVVSAGFAPGDMSIANALKFLSVTKPITPVEEAQRAYLALAQRRLEAGAAPGDDTPEKKALRRKGELDIEALGLGVTNLLNQRISPQ